MVLKILQRNRIAGFLLGHYNLENESKRLLTEDEQLISSTETVIYNESIYLLTFVLFSLILAGGLFYPSILIFWVILPIILLFSNELEIFILSNDRIIIVHRSIVEKILRIQNETSIRLDQIVVMSNTRAPINKNAFVGSLFVFLITITLIFLQNTIKILNTFLFLSIITCLAVGLYIFWVSLRLTKRSVELIIVGVSTPIWIGRTKGIPLWFVFDLQTLVFSAIPSSISHVTISSSSVTEGATSPLSTLEELTNATPIELHKLILKEIDQYYLRRKELLGRFPSYSRAEVGKAMAQLRKKRFIYFDRRLKRWLVNNHVKVGVRKQ